MAADMDRHSYGREPKTSRDDASSLPLCQDLQDELSELKRSLTESIEVLDTRFTVTSKTLIDRQQNDLGKHDHSYEKLRSEIIAFRDFLDELLSGINARLVAAEELNKNHRLFVEQAELVSNRLFRALEENRNVTAFSPQVLDEQMKHFERVLLEQTSHWRIYDNIFYGVVVLLLLLNAALLVWWQFDW